MINSKPIENLNNHFGTKMVGFKTFIQLFLVFNLHGQVINVNENIITEPKRDVVLVGLPLGEPTTL